MSDLAIVGPVGIRRMYLERQCDENIGHEHNYDHTTIVVRGRVRVLYRYLKDGREVEGETVEFGPGDTIHIKAKVRHTIKALEPDTLYLCVFSHRDFDGIVVERYGQSGGNQRAYT